MRIFIVLLFILKSLLNHSQDINKIDSLINNGIKLNAYPGAQLFFKKGDFKLYKSYGYHTYDSIVKVDDDHLFDLASITKTLASTLAIMKLYDEKKLKLDNTISSFEKKLRRSNKKNTNFHELLIHQSGWIPYINHQQFLIKRNGEVKKRLISNFQKNNSIQLANDLYIKSNYYKTIVKRIKKTKVDNNANYKYSGLFFCLVPEIVKMISNKSFEVFLNESFYSKLNLNLSFNPLNGNSKEKIVPTELDTVFRKQLIHGFVHDETAAIMGGISGNAGLFGNAKDIGKISEMFLNYGVYNNERFLSSNTVKYFTNPGNYKNARETRGLGFDKPRLNSQDTLYPSEKLSIDSYGHTGFTGTFFWIDPTNDFIIVLLTNRVYPSRSYENLYDLDIRRKLIDLII